MKSKKLIIVNLIVMVLIGYSCKKEYKCICTTVNIDYVTHEETERKDALIYKERKKETAKKYCEEYGSNCNLE